MRHRSPWAIGSVSWCTAPGAAVVGAPACLSGEGSVVKAVEGGGAGAVDEGGVAEEGDVVDCERC